MFYSAVLGTCVRVASLKSAGRVDTCIANSWHIGGKYRRLPVNLVATPQANQEEGLISGAQVKQEVQVNHSPGRKPIGKREVHGTILLRSGLRYHNLRPAAFSFCQPSCLQTSVQSRGCKCSLAE